MTILLLEDDMVLAEIMEEFLRECGHEVTCVHDGEQAEALVDERAFDLLLLDINVPGKSGLQLLAASQRRIPAILITSIQGSRELRNAFELGAADYIKKPFDLDELEARIMHVRQLYGLDEEVAISASLRFLPASLQLLQGDTTHQLKPKEAKILEFLLRHKGRIVSHEELTHTIWGYDEQPSDATLRTYIKNLRRLVGKERIVTVKGMGYRFDPV